MKEDDADVLYSDVKFTKNKKKASGTDVSEVDTTTYAEVNIRNPQQNPGPSAVSQRVKPSSGSKVRAERVVLVIAVFLLIAAGAALGVIVFKHTKTIETLRSEKAENANLTEIPSRSCPTARPPACPTTPENKETCSRCDQGWELNGGRCYYFSEDRFSWNESRRRCKNESADLVQIDSKEEQKFLANKVATRMKNDEDKFWIGLTDAAEEGEWRWVDGTELRNDLKFWIKGEPDDWKGKNNEHPEGEDCARMGEIRISDDYLKWWLDMSCYASQKRICEKAAESGKRSSVCVSDTHV